MKKLYYALFNVLLLFVSTLCFAQSKKVSKSKFEIGVEGGLTSDYLKVKDNSGNLERGKMLLSGTGGPKIRMYLNNNFFIEAAFMFKEDAFGFRFKQQDERTGSGSTNGSEIFFIPVRTGYEYKISEKVALNIIGGLSIGFVTLHAGSSQQGTLYPGSIQYTSQMRDKYKSPYFTLNQGASLSHLMNKRIKISAGVNVYYGFSDVEVYDISYRIGNNQLQQATITNRGSFINYNLGISYVLKRPNRSE